MSLEQWKKLDRTAAQYARRLFLLICVLLMLAILLTVSWQVAARQLNVVSVWTEEVSRWLFVYLSFLGFTLLSVRNDHVRVDAFLQLEVIRRIVRWTDPVVSLLRLMFYAFFVWASLALMERFGDAPSASIGITMRVLYAAVPISFILASIIEIRRFLGITWRLVRGTDVSDEERAQWS